MPHRRRNETRAQRPLDLPCSSTSRDRCARIKGYVSIVSGDRVRTLLVNLKRHLRHGVWPVLGLVLLTTLSINLPFLGPAWKASLSSMSTGTLALIGSLVYPLLGLIWEYWKAGWCGLRQHWKHGIRPTAYVAVTWWSVLFGYHLFWTVPRQIYRKAAIAELTAPQPPSAPSWATASVRIVVSKRAQKLSSDLRGTMVGNTLQSPLRLTYSNPTEEPAQLPKVTFLVLDLNHPYFYANAPTRPQPLPLPTVVLTDFVRPGEAMWGLDILNAAAKAHVQTGDKLLGVVWLTCMNCAKVRA